MLIITQAQLTALDAERSAACRVKAAALLRAKYPGKTLEQPALDQWLDRGIARARELRIDAIDEQLRFVLLRCEHGDDFDRRPWAQPLHSAEPDAKLRLAATEALAARRA